LSTYEAAQKKQKKFSAVKGFTKKKKGNPLTSTIWDEASCLIKNTRRAFGYLDPAAWEFTNLTNHFFVEPKIFTEQIV
jgi:hypothetical protein|tara:strand:- start:403 stop:636 length:234 start_codon:yes stop_codon:yes gene_type:complete